MQALDGCSPISPYFVPFADFYNHLLILFPSSWDPISFISALQPAMIPAQVRCRGCDKVFMPCGLSQHTSKTQNMHCRHLNNPPWAHFGTDSIPRVVSPYSPSPNHMAEAISNNCYGDKYSDCLDDGPNLGEDLSSGASFMTSVPNQH